MYAMQPITFTTGAEIQAPYRAPLQPGNIESGVSLGPASRLVGEPLARHVTIPGMVWGKFTSQNTRAVDQYDPSVFGALETQWALASKPFQTLNATGNASNVLDYGGGSSQSPVMPVMQVSQKKVVHKEMERDQKAAEKAMKHAKKEADKQCKAQEKAAKMAEKEAKKGMKAMKAASAGAACSKDGTCSSCG